MTLIIVPIIAWLLGVFIAGFIALKILATEAGGPSDQTGVVTFHAKLLINGKRMLHWEKSRFVREQDRWVYLDGETK